MMYQLSPFIAQNFWLIILLAVWVAPWKGWALWKAARLNQKIWFVVLLVVQTLALLDILYIFVFSRPKEEAGVSTAPKV